MEEEREQKILKVIQNCQGETDFDSVRRELAACNWDADGLISRLNREKAEKQGREQEQQMKIMQVMQQCEDLTDFDQIRAKLEANNWNADAVIAAEKSRHLIQIQLVNCANQ